MLRKPWEAEKGFEEHANALYEYNGGPYKVGVRNDNRHVKGATAWLDYHGFNPRHHLRSVLPGQIVFDLGDDTPWNVTRRHTMALWRVLDDLGIPFWGSLSGGTGTHTEIFGPPRPQSHMEPHGTQVCADCLHPVEDHEFLSRDSAWCAFDGMDCVCRGSLRVEKQPVDWRNAAFRMILDRLSRTPGAEDFEYDYRLISPKPDGRLVREFGARKEALSLRKKLPWAAPGRPWMPLPKTMAEAYETARSRGRVYPGPVPRHDELEGMCRAWVTDLTGKPCPVGPKCLNGDLCDECPAGDLP